MIVMGLHVPLHRKPSQSKIAWELTARLQLVTKPSFGSMCMWQLKSYCKPSVSLCVFECCRYCRPSLCFIHVHVYMYTCTLSAGHSGGAASAVSD